MKNNIEISSMSLQDLTSIESVLLTDFDDFWTVNILKSEILNPNSQLLVAKINNSIVGFGGVWKSAPDMHITNIVVQKKLRGQNIGTVILSNLIKIAESDKEINALTLEVHCNNVPAQKLYKKFNFNIVGTRKKYYNNTYDAIIMTKNLK